MSHWIANTDVDRKRYWQSQLHNGRMGGNRNRRGPNRRHLYSWQQARGQQRHQGSTGGRQDSGAPQRRFMAYGGRPNHKWGGGGNAGGHCPGSWYKMTIPYGGKHEKSWLRTALQDLCTVLLTPVQFHYEWNRAVFYVQNTTTAHALHNVLRKITNTEGYKVSVLMNHAPPPPNALKPKDLEHLKQCMSKRYDASQKALDLNSIHTDPDLVSHNIDVIVKKTGGIQAIMKIIEKYLPELLSLNLSNNRLYKLDEVSELVSKTPNLKILNLSHNQLKFERDLDKLRDFKLDELWLEHNPVCDHFKDQPSYISAIRKKLPRLLRLDGHVLPPTTALPACKGSYVASEEIQSRILHFLQDYYSVFDSGDRQPLLVAYHKDASFSLSTSQGWLKQTFPNVVPFLSKLPKTQHDASSFVVDVNACTETLLTFTVSGVFKEVDGKSQDTMHAFSRVFITVPAANSGLYILNDKLFVRDATTEEIRRAFATSAPMPSSSAVPTLTATQQEMLSVFSVQSGMKLDWSQKCLQDNEWDFDRAARIFTQLKAQGTIPDVAFK
ncbi:nuclear RNA export factor 1-like [Amia ocellicauda]|uniref:nuclear RNA export factor 1-like n=1 Tax=Amia ocellicauda TaxID=2972642 RepID=UPI003463CB69